MLPDIIIQDCTLESTVDFSIQMLSIPDKETATTTSSEKKIIINDIQIENLI